uniref:PhoH-like protein n=1 Tax=viral metagenome TaxID=1070528 RepID=A0A6C0DIN0_9ZZZZ
MNLFSLITWFFYLLMINNTCLILTLHHGKKMDLNMKKEKTKFKSNYYLPKSENQEKYMNYLNSPDVDLIIALGPAGTGKTFFACLKAITQIKNGEIRKLIITRPVVAVEEEEIGFLPGSLVKKMDPWTRPIFDIFLEFFSRSELDNFIHSDIIEISPLAFMRGRTFKDALIIADEMQNSTPTQMKMLITRMGVNSKMVITGDLNQSDLKIENGLEDLVKKLHIYKNKNSSLDIIKVVNFEKEDIERSELVKKILDIYENKTSTVIVQNSTNTNNDTNKIKPNNGYILNNDAALIPKHHITKNTDIFFNGL